LTENGSPLLCDRCGTRLTPGKGNFYVVRILAVADPTSPVISKEELAADVRAEIERLIEQMAKMSEQQLMDQVYRRLLLYLCVPCYQRWIDHPVRK